MKPNAKLIGQKTYNIAGEPVIQNITQGNISPTTTKYIKENDGYFNQYRVKMKDLFRLFDTPENIFPGWDFYEDHHYNDALNTGT